MPARVKPPTQILILLLTVIALGSTASAGLLNIQILGHAANPKGEADARPPSYAGPGVLGQDGDYWNGVPADVYKKPFVIRYPLAMIASDGKTRIGVTLRCKRFTSADHWPGIDGAPVTNNLMNSYLVSHGRASVMLGGLIPGSRYDLCLFGNNSHAGAGAIFTVPDCGTRKTHGSSGPVFGEGVDYVLFKAVPTDSNGQIEVSVDPGEDGLAILNGLQLSGPLPPASEAPDPEEHWNLRLWLKAEDLTQAGLKPGQKVTEWTDCARGIAFRQNSKPPLSDTAPVFEQVRGRGGADGFSAVRFNGTASLRQTGDWGLADNPVTVFVVYWPDEEKDGKWLEGIATRADALCIYDSGLAFDDFFAFHPTTRLYYTVYRENGLRLGAQDNLPAVVTGHQGEFNPGQRFKGLIAEVLVFGKLFTAEDSERQIVEDYLRRKYFGTSPPAGDKIDAPWKPSHNLKRREAFGASAGVDQVSIFSLTQQQNPSNFEYAAGEVILPFSYTAKVSEVPRPHNLDFPDEANPDNSQVFVRIDDELWQFRNHWITGKGGVTRYKGPDIDHMVRVEDAAYPPETGMGWFLGGMWYDQAERKLYAPVHVEQEGPFRSHPVSTWTPRKIALATSMDKGRTWKYEGDIITPDTYFYAYDAYKFSGSGNGNGYCDFGFYADTRGGYFYIFPEESWYYKGKWGALWNVRAARCPMSDKMAPGKWKWFYNGSWDEPALGGKSTTIAPSHMWGVIYCEFLGKYLCMLNANEDPAVPPNLDGVCIGFCSDLGRQDWTWALCPEAMFGFESVLNAEGNDVTRCGQTFRHYAYFAGNSFRRTDFTLQEGKTALLNWSPRYMFEAHPESSDPIQARQTKFVSASHPDVRYGGVWTNRAQAGSYEDRVRESSVAGSSLEIAFKGPAIYWRALRSPSSGKADVYIDGEFRKTVDCFSPVSTVSAQFVYIKAGLDPAKQHVFRVVVKGAKNPSSTGTAIAHIAFEYGAESYRASAGFCSIDGKNNWQYLERIRGKEHPLRFFPSNKTFVKEWQGTAECRIGNNYQTAHRDAQSIRRWTAPHPGTVRVEGNPGSGTNSDIPMLTRLLHNQKEIWNRPLGETPSAATRNLDAVIQLEQGDTLDFMLISEAPVSPTEVVWDPVITYTESKPAIWRPNPPGKENLARGKYARPKMLACMDQPFAAVDGDPNTAFTIYADDRLSYGPDWLQIDLDKPCTVDRYVLISRPADPNWLPRNFTVQQSQNGFVWSDVDTVTENDRQRVERKITAFTARYVRIFFPDGKPFSINELELYHQGRKR